MELILYTVFSALALYGFSINGFYKIEGALYLIAMGVFCIALELISIYMKLGEKK